MQLLLPAKHLNVLILALVLFLQGADQANAASNNSQSSNADMTEMYRLCTGGWQKWGMNQMLRWSGIHGSIGKISVLVEQGKVTEAIQKYSGLADIGVPIAMHYEGALIYSQNPTPSDKMRAVSLLKRASRFGCTLSQWTLADIYLHGNGAPQDKAVAYKWANIAAATGLQSVVQYRNQIKSLLSDSEIAEGISLSRDFSPEKVKLR